MSLFSPSDGPAEYMKFDEDNVGQPQELVINGAYFEQASMYEGVQRKNKKGVPQTEIVIPVVHDGKPKRLVVNAWRMKQAITDAVALARVDDLQVGGTLTITYTGKVKGLTPGTQAKAYSANYKAAPGDAPLAGAQVPAAPAPVPSAALANEDAGWPEPPADPWGNLS